MKNADDIKYLIRNFSIPPSDWFTECMFIAQDDESFYYKGAIFICGKDSTSKYASTSEFWVISFNALIENVRVGEWFHKAVPLIRQNEIPQERFAAQYNYLLDNYTPDSDFLECQAFEESHTNLRERNFEDSINILDDLIVSSLSISDGDYVSCFILDDQIGLSHKWTKESRNIASPLANPKN